MAVALREDGRRRELPAPVARFVRTGWPVLWISAFAAGEWQAGLVLVLLTGPVTTAVCGTRRERRQRRRAERDRRVLEHRGSWPGAVGPARRPAQVPAPAAHAQPSSAAERSLAAALVRAQTSGGRLDPGAVELVRQVDALLRPLLARVRTGAGGARVRHDVEAVATEHLPGVLEAYLTLPEDYAREHRTAAGTTPAEELRAQLVLLVEGCRQLREAVHGDDADRQQELSRFLEAKFRRSDLDL